MTERVTGRVVTADRDNGFRSWHFYVLLSMVAATVAVMLSTNTHPAALLLLSAAVISAGLVGVALHRALAGFAGLHEADPAPVGDAARAALEREKTLTLRALKDLEFDRGMRKISDADFEDLSGRLRARAISLMQELDRAPAPPIAKPAPAASTARANGPTACHTCGTPNDADARFCKQCGAGLPAGEGER